MCHRFVVWLLSFMVGTIIERFIDRRLFWAIFWKDTLSGLTNIAIVIVVQWGIMNRCSCWSGWGSTGVHLPQMDDVLPQLMYFIRHVAPWIVFGAIMFQATFCATVTWKYRNAFRVFMQRDDGVSNLGWERRSSAKSVLGAQEDGSNSNQ